MNDTLAVQFLGGEQREAFPQIKPRLRAEDRIGARTRAIVLRLALLQHALKQIQILYHARYELGGARLARQTNVIPKAPQDIHEV